MEPGDRGPVRYVDAAGQIGVALFFSCDNNETSIFDVIGTRHQGDKSIAVDGCYACIVELLLPVIGNGVIEFLLVCGIDELVEFKAGLALVIDPVIEGRQHLIFPLLIEGVEIDRGMLCQKAFS